MSVLDLLVHVANELNKGMVEQGVIGKSVRLSFSEEEAGKGQKITITARGQNAEGAEKSATGVVYGRHLGHAVA